MRVTNPTPFRRPTAPANFLAPPTGAQGSSLNPPPPPRLLAPVPPPAHQPTLWPRLRFAKPSLWSRPWLRPRPARQCLAPYLEPLNSGSAARFLRNFLAPPYRRLAPPRPSGQPLAPPLTSWTDFLDPLPEHAKLSGPAPSPQGNIWPRPQPQHNFFRALPSCPPKLRMPPEPGPPRPCPADGPPPQHPSSFPCGRPVPAPRGVL